MGRRPIQDFVNGLIRPGQEGSRRCTLPIISAAEDPDNVDQLAAFAFQLNGRDGVPFWFEQRLAEHPPEQRPAFIEQCLREIEVYRKGLHKP